MDAIDQETLKETIKWKRPWLHMPRGEYHERVLVGYDMVGWDGMGWDGMVTGRGRSHDGTTGNIEFQHDIRSSHKRERELFGTS